MSGVSLLAIDHAELRLFWEAFADSPTFERSAFMRLYKDTNADVAIKILARFHENLESTVAQVRAAISNNDAQTTFKACHKVAGSAELVGFKAFGDFSRDLSENLKTSSDFSRWAAAVSAFVSMAENIKNRIAMACPNLKNYL